VYFVQFVVGMVTPIALCVYIGLVDWVVGVSLIVAIPLTPMFLGALSKQFRKVSEKYADVNNQQSAAFLDALQGMTTLKMFNLGAKRGAEMYAARNSGCRHAPALRQPGDDPARGLWFRSGTTLVLTIVALLRMDAGSQHGQVVALCARVHKPCLIAVLLRRAIGREFARRSSFSARPHCWGGDARASGQGLGNPLPRRGHQLSGSDRPAVDRFSLDRAPVKPY
jgi:ABC-type transport system involved in cytochrome bd biosynthesis fused ATPase/permease subunit